jgi:hypothetical protein
MTPGSAGSLAGHAGSNAGTAGSSGGAASAGTASGGGVAGTASKAGTSSSSAGQRPSEGGAAGEAGEGGASNEPDLCPNDPHKLAPGSCGCGVPDTSTATLADCHGLKAALVHRYDFEGTGTAVTDRVGTAHGSVVGGAMLSKLQGRGVVVLSGGATGPYVDLPNGLVSALSSATFEAWITWGGGGAWQRIFDFGDTTAASPENNPAGGKTYLFATPSAQSGVALASYSVDGNDMGQQLEAAAAAPLAKSLSQVVVVASSTAHKLLLYIDGSKAAEQGWTGSLSALHDVNVWLGRSQYTQDPELNAVYHDFRIYNAALSDTQVATAFVAGTDPSFLSP